MVISFDPKIHKNIDYLKLTTMTGQKNVRMRARFSNFAICLILPKRHLLSFLLYFKFLKLKADGVMSRKADTIVQATRFMKIY